MASRSIHPLGLTLIAALVGASCATVPSGQYNRVSDPIPEEVKAVLLGADEFYAYRLGRSLVDERGPSPFSQLALVSKCSVTQSKRTKLLKALYKSTEKGEPVATDADPRHGIHARMGTSVVDLLLTYESGELRIITGTDDPVRVRTEPDGQVKDLASGAHSVGWRITDLFFPGSRGDVGEHGGRVEIVARVSGTVQEGFVRQALADLVGDSGDTTVDGRTVEQWCESAVTNPAALVLDQPRTTPVSALELPLGRGGATWDRVEEEDKRLPVNPFTKFALGEVCSMTMTGVLADKTRDPIPISFSTTVEAVDRDRVLVTDTSSLADATTSRFFSRERPPTLIEFLGLRTGTISSVAHPSLTKGFYAVSFIWSRSADRHLVTLWFNFLGTTLLGLRVDPLPGNTDTRSLELAFVDPEANDERSQPPIKVDVAGLPEPTPPPFLKTTNVPRARAVYSGLDALVEALAGSVEARRAAELALQDLAAQPDQRDGDVWRRSPRALCQLAGYLRTSEDPEVWGATIRLLGALGARAKPAAGGVFDFLGRDLNQYLVDREEFVRLKPEELQSLQLAAIGALPKILGQPVQSRGVLETLASKTGPLAVEARKVLGPPTLTFGAPEVEVGPDDVPITIKSTPRVSGDFKTGTSKVGRLKLHLTELTPNTALEPTIEPSLDVSWDEDQLVFRTKLSSVGPGFYSGKIEIPKENRGATEDLTLSITGLLKVLARDPQVTFRPNEPSVGALSSLSVVVSTGAVPASLWLDDKAYALEARGSDFALTKDAVTSLTKAAREELKEEDKYEFKKQRIVFGSKVQPITAALSVRADPHTTWPIDRLMVADIGSVSLTLLMKHLSTEKEASERKATLKLKWNDQIASVELERTPVDSIGAVGTFTLGAKGREALWTLAYQTKNTTRKFDAELAIGGATIHAGSLILDGTDTVAFKPLVVQGKVARDRFHELTVILPPFLEGAGSKFDRNNAVLYLEDTQTHGPELIPLHGSSNALYLDGKSARDLAKNLEDDQDFQRERRRVFRAWVMMSPVDPKKPDFENGWSSGTLTVVDIVATLNRSEVKTDDDVSGLRVIVPADIADYYPDYDSKNVVLRLDGTDKTTVALELIANGLAPTAAGRSALSEAIKASGDGKETTARLDWGYMSIQAGRLRLKKP